MQWAWGLIYVGGAYFFISLLLIIAKKPTMFTPSIGQFHALVGLSHFTWLFVGFLDTYFNFMDKLFFDTMMGVLGIILTLSAAFGFPSHKKVRNPASGVLEQETTVTYSEMIEHCFYQILNLAQSLYLHSLSSDLFGDQLWKRILALGAATSPWLFRHYFPINRFSDNYNQGNDGTLVAILYRLKKYQYVFYKHWLFYGLNITFALKNQSDLATTTQFRLFWMCLNTAYVMEFFLQTLVKRRHMPQSNMLILNQLLMFISSVSVLPILTEISQLVSVLSLVFNFVNRKSDFMNTVILVCGVLVVTQYFGITLI